MVQINGSTAPPLNKLTLRFESPGFEKEFLGWIYASRNVRTRLAMLLVCFLYAVLGMLDPLFSTGAIAETARQLHFYVVIPMLLATVLLGSVRGGERIFIPASIVTTATAAVCNLYLVHHQGLESYYVPELYFMVIWVFSIAGFRLQTAIVFGTGMVAAAVVNALSIPDAAPRAVYEYFFWLFVALSLAYLGGHLLEYYAKVNFYNLVRLQWEIDEREKAQGRLKHAALHDPLTGLPNRVLLSDRLAGAILQAERKREKVGWLYIDLDHFKQINDTHGHGAGDRLLATVGQRLRTCVRESDTVGRLGGDEFTVLLTGIRDAGDALRIAEQIRAGLETPCDLGGGVRFDVSASIGVALYPDHGGDETALSKSADAAMYRSKNAGRNAVTMAGA